MILPLHRLTQRIPDLGLVRSSAVVLAGDSLARALGFLFAVAAARLLTPSGYGHISYALAVAAIVSVLTVNAPFGLSRFLARHRHSHRRRARMALAGALSGHLRPVQRLGARDHAAPGSDGADIRSCARQPAPGYRHRPLRLAVDPAGRLLQHLVRS